MRAAGLARRCVVLRRESLRHCPTQSLVPNLAVLGSVSAPVPGAVAGSIPGSIPSPNGGTDLRTAQDTQLHVSHAARSWLGEGDGGRNTHVDDLEAASASGHGFGRSVGHDGRRNLVPRWRRESANDTAFAIDPAVHVRCPVSSFSCQLGYGGHSRFLFSSSSSSSPSSSSPANPSPASNLQSENGGGGSSWLDRLKRMTGFGKKEDRSDSQPAEHFTLEDFADQLKQARQFGGLTQFGRGLPRGGESAVTHSLKRQETLLRALSAEQKNSSLEFDASVKERVAANCGCTVADVNNVLSKFDWVRRAHQKVEQMKKEGKELPKTLQEMEEVMGGRWSPDASRSLAKGQTSRNSPCPCGSGKKFKRCCGKGPATR